MDFKANEIKAGATIFIAGTLLLIFLVAILSINVGEETKEYLVTLNYVGGIEEGSLVKYGGMDVGAVAEISFPETNKTGIELKLKVDNKTPVRIDSEAFISSVGIMADQHIEVSSGTPGAALLKPGNLLKGKEVASFMQMAEPLSDVSSQVQELLSGLKDILSDENRGHLSSMVANMDGMMIDARKNFIKLTDNLATLSTDLNTLMTTNKENFEKTIANIENTTKQTDDLIKELRGSITKFEGMLSTNGTSMVEIMENFQFTSQNLEEFSRIVKERPWLLIRKDAPPERKMP